MNASTSQRGAVLIVALVFMLIISVLGVASMRNATMQERMAGNNKDINIAFQAAEAAVREAEAAMDALASIDFDGSNGLYLSCPDTTDTRTACSEPDWQQRASTGWKVVDDELSNVLRQPEYIMAHSAATELVEGVENLQLMYGVDDNDDRSVDRYIAAGSVSDWETVLSVRVELTMVALDEGVVGKTGADNAQTVYDSEGKLINNSDGRMRQVFTSVFALRNRLP